MAARTRPDPRYRDSQARVRVSVARPYSVVKDLPAAAAQEFWWAWVESNYRPHPYQGCALAT